MDVSRVTRVPRSGLVLSFIAAVYNGPEASLPPLRQRTGGLPLVSGEWLQDHHRNLALGLLLIAIVVRPDRGHQPPECGLLFGGGSPRPRPELVAAYLHLDLRVHDEVQIPLGVLVRAALRRDYDVAAAVAPVNQPRPPELAGLPAARREEQRVHAPPAVPLLPLALDIATDVLGDPADGAIEDLLLR